jgi:hypothetical protein
MFICKTVFVILLSGLLLPVICESAAAEKATALSAEWSGWTSLGKPVGNSIAPPAVGYNQDGRMELFGVGGNGHVWHIWQSTPNGNWTSWLDFTGGTTYCVAVGSYLDGRMDLFALQYDFVIWHIWQGSINAPFVSSWQSLDWPSGATGLTCPRVGRNADGRLEVFTIGFDGDVWSMPQAAPNGGWGAWAYFGKPTGRTISSLVVGQEQDGRQTIYVLGDDKEVYFNYQTIINNGWSGWVGMGKPVGINLNAYTVGQNADGRQEIFAIGEDGRLWHKWQVAANNIWYGWATLDKPPSVFILKSYSPPTTAIQPDGSMVVVAVTTDSNIWQITRPAKSNIWGSWESLGQPAVGLQSSAPVTGRHQNGRPVIFAVGQDGNLYQNSYEGCSGDVVVLQNTTFTTGNTYNCTATTSITAGTGVTVQNGATVNFRAPKINLQPGFKVESGAVFSAKQ